MPLEKTLSTVEEHRAQLQRILKQQPHNRQLWYLLRASLKPSYIRHAAQNGVFVGYHRSDDLFALELTTRLKSAGVPAWMDELDMPVQGDWLESVGEAMRRCGVMLLVLSDDACDDELLQAQRRYFINVGKIVLPVTNQPRLTGWRTQLAPIDFSYNSDQATQRLLSLVAPQTAPA